MAAHVDGLKPAARPPTLAVLLGALAVLLGALAVLLLVGAWVVFARMPGGPRDGFELGYSLISIATVGAGLIISWRVRRNPVGPLIVAFGAMEAWIVARSAWYWGSFLMPGFLPQP